MLSRYPGEKHWQERKRVAQTNRQLLKIFNAMKYQWEEEDKGLGANIIYIIYMTPHLAHGRINISCYPMFASQVFNWCVCWNVYIIALWIPWEIFCHCIQHSPFPLRWVVPLPEYKKHLSCVRRNRIRTILWRREQEMAKNRLRLRTSSSIAWLNDIFAKKLLMYCETFVHSKPCSTSCLLIQCFYEVSPIYRFII